MPKPPSNFDDVRSAHGILASIAFVIIMPLSAILIRTMSIKNLIWLHAGGMIFAYILALAALGLGIWMAYVLHHFDTTHVIIGLTVVGGALLQPVSGLVHHFRYRRAGHSTASTFFHLWWGRAIITLAIINGGIGLHLAARYQPHTSTGEVVYGVVAAVMWLTWMTVILTSFIKSKGVKEGETRRRISISDEEKQSVDGVNASETGSDYTRNNSVVEGV